MSGVFSRIAFSFVSLVTALLVSLAIPDHSIELQGNGKLPIPAPLAARDEKCLGVVSTTFTFCQAAT